jgi:hypothetical protein
MPAESAPEDIVSAKMFPLTGSSNPNFPLARTACIGRLIAVRFRVGCAFRGRTPERIALPREAKRPVGASALRTMPRAAGISWKTDDRMSWFSRRSAFTGSSAGSTIPFGAARPMWRVCRGAGDCPCLSTFLGRRAIPVRSILCLLSRTRIFSAARFGLRPRAGVRSGRRPRTASVSGSAPITGSAHMPRPTALSEHGPCSEGYNGANDCNRKFITGL